MSSEAGPSQSIAQATAGKKRKRTGKERQERKQAAILAAQSQAQSESVPAQDGETSSQPPPIAQQEPQVERAEMEGVDFDLLSKRLPRAVTHLRHVFKRAKTIEMTRLIKKIKQLRKKNEAGTISDLADLEAQRQILSHLNIASTLSTHLLTNLRKHRLIKRTPDALPTTVVEELKTTETSTPSSSSSAETIKKVENRLFSSKTAAQETKSAVAWLFNEQGAKLGNVSQSQGTRQGTGSAAGIGGKGTGKKSGQVNADVVAEDGEESDVGSVSSARLQVADESDDEADAAGWESGSVSGGEAPKSGSRRHRVVADSDESEDDDAISLSPQPTPAKKSKATPLAASKQLTSSTFLPSLSTGFTRGGSDDSDPDDDFGEGLEDIIGKGSAGVRKNRRGQQARRAIWERKYGKNAKHVQKAKAQELEGNIANAYGKRAGAKSNAGQKLNATQDSRPAPAPGPTKPAHQPRPASSSSTAPPHRPESSHAAPPKAASLHPSWEAARLRKQKEAAGPKATKIVFD